jgi:hypothetical protein
MTVEYKDLKRMVKEAMFIGGGINEPSAPEGIPHREPAADPTKDTGDPKANELYDLAYEAREATERLIVALDDSYYDKPYEHAFKATMALRDVLNSIRELGAKPPPEKLVVAPPRRGQKYFGTAPFRSGDSDGSGEGY